VPLPGSAIPSASHRQFIELAVNMPEHEPHVGQPYSSSVLSWASSILPSAKAISARRSHAGNASGAWVVMSVSTFFASSGRRVSR